jgi:hypothetical protein
VRITRNFTHRLRFVATHERADQHGAGKSPPRVAAASSRLSWCCSSAVRLARTFWSAACTASSTRFNNALPFAVSCAGSARPDETLAGRATAPLSCKPRSTLFIACGDTLVSRASSALDLPGDIDKMRRQTNSGNPRSKGRNAVVTVGRSSDMIRWIKYPSGWSSPTSISIILTYINLIDIHGL